MVVDLLEGELASHNCKDHGKNDPERKLGDAAGEVMYKCGYEWGLEDMTSFTPRVQAEYELAVNKMSMGRYRHIPVRKADGSYSVTSIKHVLKYIAKAEW